MARICAVLLFLTLMFTGDLHASQSTITEAEGAACMGDDRSRKQTEQAALTDAKKKAVEYTATYIKGETQVKNFVLEKDLLAAYANAEVKIIEDLSKEWYKDPAAGDCLKYRIRAEVTPDRAAMEKIASQSPAVADDPAAPLTVRVWTDRKEYRQGEKIKVFLRGNKPFYARVIYQDAAGGLLQLLPNPHRTENYFNGGTVYEIPAGGDRFDLEVSPPFGEESIIVYGSTAPLGDIDVQTGGSVFQVRTKPKDIPAMTRGIKLTEKKNGGSVPAASEFYEDKVVLKTGK